MIKKLCLAAFLAFAITVASAQSVGFSYFFPKNGYFSNPIAPVNFSLPISFGKFFQISPGIGMYNIGGMSMIGFSEIYNSERPLVGPFQSLELTALPALILPFKNVKLEFGGGVFGFFAFNQKLLSSEFSDMIKTTNAFTAFDCNTQSPKSGFGWGYLYGVKLKVKVTKSAWAYVGLHIYNGRQNYKISGDYRAIVGSSTIEEGFFEFNNSQILYNGIQLSIGAVLK
jgi:hypothetical protein